MNPELQSQTDAAIEAMKAVGFDQAEAASITEDFDELNINNNSVNLFRTVSKSMLRLKGIVDGRKATRSLSLTETCSLADVAKELWAAAIEAPQDSANRVSAGQIHDYVDGPLDAEKDKMVGRLQELFAHRALHTKKANINNGALKHIRRRSVMTTSEGTRLCSDLGWYEAHFLVVGQEGDKVSSMSYNFGACRDIDTAMIERFGTHTLLSKAEKQIHTDRLSEAFVGSVLLSPITVTELLTYLHRQTTDHALLSGASMFVDKVGEQIAMQGLNITHHAKGPGAEPHSADGYMLEDFSLVQDGRLQTLLPSDYASRKCSLKHQPSGNCFSIAPGTVPKDELLSEIYRGALVGRLSMGTPAANGDFSGVIKNSFIINDGELGSALSDTMITGNVAQMLKDIDGISLETVDFGTSVMPWIRIPNLAFS